MQDGKNLVAIATKYFRDPFTSSNPKLIEEALANVTATISNQLNADLTFPVLEWEVKLALFAMHSEKAPGPYLMASQPYSIKNSGTL